MLTMVRIISGNQIASLMITSKYSYIINRKCKNRNSSINVLNKKYDNKTVFEALVIYYLSLLIFN